MRLMSSCRTPSLLCSYTREARVHAHARARAHTDRKHPCGCVHAGGWRCVLKQRKKEGEGGGVEHGGWLKEGREGWDGERAGDGALSLSLSLSLSNHVQIERVGAVLPVDT
eukprot:Tamp_34396.p2 GENE.Tamp_34396~~Tamp_34396.p2  ORF type:complete len:111 (-),score=11.41 Tamp_34396:126-458(-)